MRKIIEQRTKTAKQVKGKKEELQSIKERLDDINKKDLFQITFDDFRDKDALTNYYSQQTTKLVEYQNALNNDLVGDLSKQIADHIRKEADNDQEVIEAFEPFEAQPSNQELQEAYYKAYNDKVDELHNEALDLLTEYFETIDDNQGRSFRKRLEIYLPAPIRIVEVETKKESEKLGISYSYANRKVKRSNM